MTYTTENSGRVGLNVDASLAVSFSPGTFAAIVEDPSAHSTHRLSNRRFNLDARDSPVDLLARAKWRSEWYDRSIRLGRVLTLS